MNFNSKSVLSVLVVAMLAMATLSGGALAAPSTTTESDVAGGDHLELDPSSDEVEKLKFDVTNTNTSSVTVTVTDTGDSTQLYSVSDTDAAMTLENGTYTANLSHADISNEANRSVGEDHDLEVQMDHTHDDNGDGTTTTATTTFNVTAEIVSTSDEQTVLVSDSVGDSVGPTVDVEEASDGFLGFFADDHDTYEASNNVPHGQYGYNNTTVIFEGATADAFDAGTSDVSAGDSLYGMTVLVNGEVVPVYADSAGDVHENGSYAVYNTNASELTVEFGEEREDAYATDVTVVNNDPLDEVGFTAVMDVWGIQSAVDLSVPFVGN